jgi:hypothetical protein
MSIFSLKMKIPSIKCSKVVVADLEVLLSAFCFGIGFLGQRAVSVDGLGMAPTPHPSSCLYIGP